ncbi:MAG: DUF4407 domain-containing protein [Verrucomicrobiaceae bacterium]|nr:DUF4407 domain-containing protein [Verrucomicrobiaceae bacterium]
MTQLIKLPPVQKKPQNARDEPRLLDRRNQTAAAPEPVQLHRPSFFKRMILAVMRILMAATLGTVVSHCLVLGIFQKKVISQVEANREVRRKEIEANFSKQATPVKDDLAMVEGILSSPPADMVERFNAWQLSRGKSTAAGADGGAQSAPVSAVEQKFATVLKPFDDQLLRASSEMNEARKTLALITADLEEMHTEMKAAKQMRDDERLGVQKTFPAWTTSAFTQTAMPTETSGKPDQGFKWRIINETIKLAEQVIEGRTKEQKTAQDAVDRITKEIDDIKKSRTEAFNKVAGANTAQIEEMEKARAAKLTGDVKRVEAGLETQASDLKASIAKLQAQRATELKPVTGEGYDLMEQTAALHNLTSIKAGGGEQTSVLLLVGVIMLCLMFIDLTPLLMKIMRSPGYYEHALVDPYTPPAPQQPQYTSAPAYAAPVQRSAAPPPPPPGMV